MWVDTLILTLFFMLFFQYLYKIFLNQHIDSTVIVTTTLLFAIWLTLTDSVTNFIYGQNQTMGKPSPWI